MDLSGIHLAVCTASQIIGGGEISQNFVAFSEYMNFIGK